MSKIIRNVNVLDITTTSEEALQSITKIANVNVMLYSKATAGLLSQTALENVNVQAEVPANAVLSSVNGRYEVVDSLSADNPLLLIVNGKLVFRSDTNSETVSEGIAGILVNGTIYCPESLTGFVRQKIIQHNGRLAAYMQDADLIEDTIRMDNAFLQTCRPESSISFGGKVIMLDDLDSNLLAEKLSKIEFLNELIVREDLLAAISGKMVSAHKGKIVIIPGGTYYHEGDLNLTSSVLKRLKHKRIHATGVLLFGHDITAEDLNHSVDNLCSEKMIICPQSLIDVVIEKTSDPAIEILAYTGKLRIIDGEYKLRAAELKSTEQPVSLIVNGVLNISEDIDVELLARSLGIIVNHGVINGNGEQCGIVQLKTVKNNGVISDTDSVEDHDQFADPTQSSDEVFIQNANVLKL